MSVARRWHDGVFASTFVVATTSHAHQMTLSHSPGVSGPDNDQDQTTTTLRGRCVVQKFQDQAPTCQDCQPGQNLVLKIFWTRQRRHCVVLKFQDHTMTSEKCLRSGSGPETPTGLTVSLWKSVWGKQQEIFKHIWHTHTFISKTLSITVVKIFENQTDSLKLKSIDP